METKLKILTAMALPYAFLCAGIYQLAYWLPFEINGFSFLGITDIIMSFIQPFLYSSFATFLLVVIQYYQAGSIESEKPVEDKPKSRNMRLIIIALEFIYVAALILANWFLDLKQKSLFLPFLIIGGLFIVVPVLLKKIGYVGIKNWRYIINFAILLPVLSYYYGAKNAYTIFDNFSFEYSTRVLNQPLKFLGKASDYYIFVSLDNKEKFFFSTSEIKGLSLRKFER
jgi:uncharacterized membrane protein YwzB